MSQFYFVLYKSLDFKRKTFDYIIIFDWFD